MAAISRTPHLDRAINTATILTRTAVAVGVPLYLYLNLDSIPTLSSPPAKLIAGSVAVLSAPSTLYCALGAINGAVETCIQYFNYLTGTNPEFHWDQFSKEVKTTRGLIEASVSPLAGYTFMHHEWNKLGSGNDKDKPRVLKEEYLVYSLPRAIGHQLVEAGKWTLRQLKIGFDRSVAQMTSTVKTLWSGVCWVADTTVSIIKWTWKITEPARELAWNIAIAAKNWTLDRLLDLWHFTEPLITLIWDKVAVQLIWTSLLKTFLGHFVIETVIWGIILKTVVWDFFIMKVIVDVIATKIIWNLICELIIGEVIWPLVRFAGEKILWPFITSAASILGTMIMLAFAAITWATQRAFGRR